MDKNIIAFSTSNSRQSINKQLVQFVSSKLENIKTTILDLNDFELPLYSIDLEKQSGIPSNAVRFSKLIEKSDAIIISLAEHNGLYTSVFKNLFDWMSRMGSIKIWHDKPMFLLGTSPGKREESNVMKLSKEMFPKFGANIISTYHLPSFNHFFKDGKIVEERQIELFNIELQRFQTILNL